MSRRRICFQVLYLAFGLGLGKTINFIVKSQFFSILMVCELQRVPRSKDCYPGEGIKAAAISSDG